MNTPLIWDNLVSYSMQIGLLVGLAAFVPTVLRLRLPAPRLAYWHLLLAACLILPALRPWKQTVLTLTTPVVAPLAAPLAAVPMPPAPPVPLFHPAQIALVLLGVGMAVRLAWLASGFWRLARLRRHSTPLHPVSSWGVEADIRVSDAIASPVTFGLWRPAVLLPANFPELEAPAREAILCHEILHVRRHDWLFTLAEELIRTVFWFHPAIWWLLGEIGLAREQVVDREVIALTRCRDQYLDALLTIAGAPPSLDLAPAPLFLRKRHLKQRVLSIMKEVRMSKTRSISSLAAGLGFLALACWLVTAAFPLAAAPQAIADSPGVTVDTGGAVMHRSAIPYPEAARAKGIQGVVTVEATVDGGGSVIETRVLGGPAELRRAAQQSVLGWHFATDTSLNTRTVKMTFELPAPSAGAANAANAAPPAPPLDAATRANAAAQINALRAQLKDLAPQLQSPDPAIRQQASSRFAEMQKETNLLSRRAGDAMYDGTHLTKISVSGLSQQSAMDLQARLPVHVGDTLSADLMDRMRAAVREYDEHLSVGTGMNNNQEVSINISTPGGSSTYYETLQPSARGAGGGVLGGIVGSVPSAAPMVSFPPAADGTRRIAIGGNVQQAKLVSQPTPVYPPLAKQAHISGVVHLAAVIGKDGNVTDLKVISGHPLLIQASMDAVQQWVYQKTLLNGEPVEVQTQIDVNFTLSE